MKNTSQYLPLILVSSYWECQHVRSGFDLRYAGVTRRDGQGRTSKDGTGSSFPDTSFSGRDESNNLRGWIAPSKNRQADMPVMQEQRCRPC